MAIAMSVGATKIRILQENAIGSLPAKKSKESKKQSGQKSGIT
jgi:hypothetical protein